MSDRLNPIENFQGVQDRLTVVWRRHKLARPFIRSVSHPRVSRGGPHKNENRITLLIKPVNHDVPSFPYRYKLQRCLRKMTAPRRPGYGWKI